MLVVQLLRDLAVKEQLIVMCTIHQPRSSIWNMFDDVMLLTPYGQTAYHGPRAEAVEYFSNLGYHCPAATNPAEFLVDLVSIDSSTIESKKDSEARIAHLTVSFAAAAAYTSVGGGVSQITMAGARRAVKSSLFRPLQIAAKRTWLLFQRSVRQTLRDYATNIVRLGTSGVLAIVVGSVYGRQGHLISSESVAGRVNIIAQAVINVAMLSMIKTLQLFKKERSVVDRERAQEQYTSLEYLIAKSCAELPMDAMVSAVR